eukprot:tig00020943_g16275.t1
MEEIMKSRGGRSARTSEGAATVRKAQEEELEELRQLMHKNYYKPLRTIFRYYARLDGAKVKSIAVRSRNADNDDMYTVSKYEFDAFVKDCKMLSKSLPSAKVRCPDRQRVGFILDVELIFISANREDNDAGPAAAAATKASDANTKLTMVLPEFLNAVVRVAEAKYAKEARNLAGRLSLLMEKNVLPHAKWDDVEEFRQLIRHETVQEAVAAARPTMRLLFEKYCALDLIAARTFGAHKNQSVSIREFVTMFEDLGLLKEKTLSQKDVQDAFATAQADPVMDDEVTQADDHGADSMEELDAVEFEEALVRCAVARYCAAKELREREEAAATARSLGAKSFRSGKSMSSFGAKGGAGRSFRSLRSLSMKFREPPPGLADAEAAHGEGEGPGPGAGAGDGESTARTARTARTNGGPSDAEDGGRGPGADREGEEAGDGGMPRARSPSPSKSSSRRLAAAAAPPAPPGSGPLPARPSSGGALKASSSHTSFPAAAAAVRLAGSLAKKVMIKV